MKSGEYWYVRLDERGEAYSKPSACRYDAEANTISTIGCSLDVEYNSANYRLTPIRERENCVVFVREEPRGKPSGLLLSTKSRGRAWTDTDQFRVQCDVLGEPQDITLDNPVIKDGFIIQVYELPDRVQTITVALL